jgi:alanine dehydrogenase
LKQTRKKDGGMNNVRFLSERDVEELLDVPNCAETIEKSLIAQGRKEAQNVPRHIVRTEKVGLSVLQAAVPGFRHVGFKSYTTCPEGVRFWVMLFNAETGAWEAIIEAEHLGLVRTAAATGVASKHLANSESSIVGILGTGTHAVAQLEGACLNHKIKRVYAWSRTPENVREFAGTMSKKLGIEVVPAGSAEDAVRDADIVVTITSSQRPILCGDWLKPGAHVNLVGAMKPSSREVDDRTLERANLLAVDDWDQAHHEAGEYIEATRDGVISWEKIKELGDIMAGVEPGRAHEDDITVFKSHGIGIWDVAAAAQVLEIARNRKIGLDLPIGLDARPLGKTFDPYRIKP